MTHRAIKEPDGDEAILPLVPLVVLDTSPKRWKVAEGEPSQHPVKPFSRLSYKIRCVLLLQLELFEFVSRAENPSQAEWSSCLNLNYRIRPIESRRSPEHLCSV